MRRILIAVFGIVVAGGCGDDKPTGADSSDLPGHIVFATWDSCPETGRIYRMNADGSAVTPLVSGEQPLPSPDGSLIAFTRQSQLFVMASDGTGERNLGARVTGGSAWSPTGNRLTTVAEGKLLLFFPATSIPDTLYDAPEIGFLDGHIGSPWSSDGQLVYFHIGGGGNEAGVYELSTLTGNATLVFGMGLFPFVNEVLGRVVFWHDGLWRCTLRGGLASLCYRTRGWDVAISHDRYWVAHGRDVMDLQGAIVREDIFILNLGLCGSDSLASSGGDCDGIAWAPDDEYLVICRPALGGAPYDELIILDAKTGSARNISGNLPRCQLTSVGWSQ